MENTKLESQPQSKAIIFALFAVLALVVASFGARWFGRHADPIRSTASKVPDIDVAAERDPEPTPPNPEGESVGAIAALSASPEVVRDEQAATPAAQCPSAEPANATNCQAPANGSLSCAYGEGKTAVDCECSATTGDRSPVWNCRRQDAQSAVTRCPASMPTDGARCELAGQICFYGEAESARACECPTNGTLSWTCITQIEFAGRRH